MSAYIRAEGVYQSKILIAERAYPSVITLNIVLNKLRGLGNSVRVLLVKIVR